MHPVEFTVCCRAGVGLLSQDFMTHLTVRVPRHRPLDAMPVFLELATKVWCQIGEFMNCVCRGDRPAAFGGGEEAKKRNVLKISHVLQSVTGELTAAYFAKALVQCHAMQSVVLEQGF